MKECADVISKLVFTTKMYESEQTDHKEIYIQC
jgi:hypothetical protein